MPAQLHYGTAGATGGGFSAIKGVQHLFEEARCDVRPAWCWQRRGANTWKDTYRWASLWPTSRFAGGAEPGQGYVPLGMGLEASGMFEPFSCDGAGCATAKYIKGTVVDASDNPVPGATVRGFVASTGAFCGYEVQSRADGSFDLPTSFPGVAHYFVAYIAGSPDRGGTSVNTLIPTGIDGA